MDYYETLLKGLLLPIIKKLYPNGQKMDYTLSICPSERFGGISAKTKSCTRYISPEDICEAEILYLSIYLY